MCLLGILIGVEVGAQGEPGTDATEIFLNEFRYLLQNPRRQVSWFHDAIPRANTRRSRGGLPCLGS